MGEDADRAKQYRARAKVLREEAADQPTLTREGIEVVAEDYERIANPLERLDAIKRAHRTGGESA